MPALESTFALMITAAVATAASLLLSQMPASDGHMLMDEQTRLLTWTLSGGIGGGLVGVLLFPLTSIRQMAGKWLGSAIIAVLFAPACARYFSVEKDMIYSLAIAGTISLTGWGLLYWLIPLLPIFVGRFLRFEVKRRTGFDEFEIQPGESDEPPPGESDEPPPPLRSGRRRD